jgi:hypothetical protein
LQPGKYRTRGDHIVQLMYFNEKAHLFPGKVKREDNVFYTVTFAGKRLINVDDEWDLQERISD